MLGRPQQQFGAEGVIYHVQHGFQRRERGGVQQALSHVGVHAAGGGVDDDLHVPAAHRFAVSQRAVLAGTAGRQYRPGTAVPANCLHGGMGAAGAEDQHHFIGEIHLMGPGQIGKARVVGVITV